MRTDHACRGGPPPRLLVHALGHAGLLEEPTYIYIYMYIYIYTCINTYIYICI